MNELPVKLCECGCGEPTPIAKRSNTKLGYRRGKPCRFIVGHNLRKRALKEGLLKCSRCGTYKAIDDFGNTKGGIFGKSGWCRNCMVEYRKANKVSKKWELAHPDQSKLIHKRGARKEIQELRKVYLKQRIQRTLDLSRNEITEEMIDLKREQLTMKRLIKTGLKEEEKWDF